MDKVKQFIEAVSGVKGANVNAVWQRPMKTLKAARDLRVDKRTEAVIRTGVTYDNLTLVKEGRADGTLPEENAGIRGEWVTFPYHYTNKGQDYLRLYPASGIEFTPKVTYFIDGVEASREQVIPLCQKGEFDKKGEPPLCFSIKAESLKGIRGINLDS